jgi:hypothetical protein
VVGAASGAPALKSTPDIAERVVVILLAVALEPLLRRPEAGNACDDLLALARGTVFPIGHCPSSSYWSYPTRIGIIELGVNAEQAVQECDDAGAEATAPVPSPSSSQSVKPCYNRGRQPEYFQ